MVVLNPPHLNEELIKSRILARTGTRVHNLEIQFSPEGVTLFGETASYYVKQLAQQGVLDALPEVRLRNQITVSEPHFNETQHALETSASHAGDLGLTG
jgi:hypothetical protein